MQRGGFTGRDDMGPASDAARRRSWALVIRGFWPEGLQNVGESIVFYMPPRPIAGGLYGTCASRARSSSRRELVADNWESDTPHAARRIASYIGEPTWLLAQGPAQPAQSSPAGPAQMFTFGLGLCLGLGLGLEALSSCLRLAQSRQH